MGAANAQWHDTALGRANMTHAQSDNASPVIERIPTLDGAVAACKRRPNPGGAPVILLHGIAVNADIWDLPPIDGPDFSYRSLASILQDAGFDVWLMNLRGCGAPHMLSQPALGQQDWCVDHLILFDLPAVIDAIRAATGRRPLVIGQSLGAMVLAAYLQGATLAPDGQVGRIVADPAVARRRQDDIAAAVFVEIPAALRWPRSAYDEAGRLNWPVLLKDFWKADAGANYPFELLARWGWLEAMILAAGGARLDLLRPDPAARLIDALPPALADAARKAERKIVQAGLNLVGTFTGHTNHRAEVMIRGRRFVIDAIAGGVLRQLAKCVRQGRFVSDLGAAEHAYSDHYHEIELPTLLVLGGRDRIASHEVAREAFYEKLRSSDKTLHFYPEIGHGEFEAAPVATQRVYPPLVEWLNARRGA